MPTATAILSKRYTNKDKVYPIVIRLSNGKEQKLHSTGYKVPERCFNGQVIKHPDAAIINSVIDDKLLKAKQYFADCQIRGHRIDLSLVFKAVRSHSFIDYLNSRAKSENSLEMALKCSRFAKEFTHVFGSVYFSELDQDLMRKYDAYLISIGNQPNTRYKKFEFLSKYFNNALAEGKAQGQNPFFIYKKTIRQTPVKKEKLSIEEFQAIENLPLKGSLALARDMFLFSYFCKGARFETCITMRKDSIKKGRLDYQSNKGKQHFTTLLHPKLKAIVDRYKDNNTEYIFGRRIDLSTQKSKRSTIGSENAYINKLLKQVGEMAGVKDLSFHIARHTLAYHLKKVSPTINAISDVLGHSSSRVTEVYLKALDDPYLDKLLGEVYGE